MKTRILTKLLSSVLCAALTMQAGWVLKTGRVNAAASTSVVLYTQDLPGFSEDNPIYAGENYDFINGVSTDPMGYEGYVTFEYASINSESYSSAKPTTAGAYKVRAVLPSSSQWTGSTSEAYTYTIRDRNALALSAVSATGDYYKIEGTYSSQWGTLYIDTVRVVPASGFLIACPTVGGDVFASYLDVDPSQMTGALFRYKRISDGKTTDYTSAGNFSYLVPDERAPEFEDYCTLDGVRISDIRDGFTFRGSEMRIIVYDHHLYKFKINDEVVFEQPSDSWTNVVGETITCAPGEEKIINVYVLDYANRTLEATIILINPLDPELKVTIPDSVYVGDDYNINAVSESDGPITIIYKDANDADADYTLTKPTSAGTYTVKVSVAQTSKYDSDSYTGTLKILKKTTAASVSVADAFVGDDYAPQITTTSDGTVTYLYRNDDIADSEFTDTKPTAAGNYTVLAIISESGTYNEITCTDSFSINKRTPTAKVSIPDIRIGESYLPTLTTDSDGRTDAVYEYKLTGADDSTYKTAKPITVGDYTVRVTIPETDKYKAVTATDEFSIKRKIPTLTVNYGSPYVGTEYKPSITTNSDGAAKAIIEYKEKNALDDKYTTTAPTTFGTYIARVTIPETPSFASIMTTIEFDVIYLEAPAKPFELTGTAGKNDYYVSTVELKAPAGYTISAIFGGTYTESITYTDTLTSVYLKRTEDNALTSAIAVNKLKIDTQAPSFKAGTGNVVSGSVMYVSNLNLTVDDPNLKSLKVNGEPVNLSTDNDNVLTLSPGFGTKTFKITAEDEAGNVSNIEFTLKAEWLESKTIIPDVVLPLEGNDYYNLSDGYWVVTRNTPEGPVQDSTVYSGGMPFYVEESGEYTFTRVT